MDDATPPDDAVVVTKEFKMVEVVNPEIAVDAVAMDQSRINPKLEHASEFEEEDASEFEEGELRISSSSSINTQLEFCEITRSLERVELVASKGNTNPNGENRLMEVYMATEVSKNLEQVGSINLMLKPEKSLEPVAIQSWQGFKMAEVVNPEIDVEAVARDESRINPKLERTEDTKQPNQTDSSNISDVPQFSGLLKDASEHEGRELASSSSLPIISQLEFHEVSRSFEQVELAASKGNGNPNGEKGPKEVNMATEVSITLETVGSSNLMLKPEKSLEPVAIEVSKTLETVGSSNLILKSEKSLEPVAMESQKVTDHRELVTLQATTPNRRISAFRDFPPGCGRKAPYLSKKECQELIVTSKLSASTSGESRPRKVYMHSDVSRNVRQKFMDNDDIERKKKTKVTAETGEKIAQEWEEELRLKERDRESVPWRRKEPALKSRLPSMHEALMSGARRNEVTVLSNSKNIPK
ncbi:hypothetical protein GIB67_007318 [Kingdonia uniflora]|uniref:Uncharacterized protein n=1 Tax=Kingdonia uniflora TaxID=39325 RepID=A0A7J7NX64_9MAGN|nr:hypothetical protein GIB67_007318 [Kingdonia uniflora]